MKTLRCIVTLLVIPILARAELRWRGKELEFHPSASDTEVKAKFIFANSGAAPVIIE